MLQKPEGNGATIQAEKTKMLDKTLEEKPKDDFFDNIVIDIFLFSATIISMLTIVAIIHLMCRHSN